MKKQKKYFISIILSACMLIFPLTSYAGGIPVFDGAQVANTLQQIIHMKEQIDNQIQQIAELKNQVSALTGSKGVGSAFSETALEQLPTEWKDLYGSIANTDYKKMIQGKTYTPDTAMKQLVNNYDSSVQAFNDTKLRLNNLQKMIKKIDSTTDIKAAQDLQNRIAAESAIIQNNQTKLDMMARLAEQMEKIEYYKRMDRRSCYAKNFKSQNWDACK
ncbi:type IV secretion system protein [Neisseria sp. Ec49-e6-T10]|uniref:type IV secretion system protein n=1 Tax=Neisseria sp. Ec49-e6-T10 TaxID=3140744 RepID=UPI003EC0EF7E